MTTAGSPRRSTMNRSLFLVGRSWILAGLSPALAIPSAAFSSGESGLRPRALRPDASLRPGGATSPSGEDRSQARSVLSAGKKHFGRLATFIEPDCDGQ